MLLAYAEGRKNLIKSSGKKVQEPLVGCAPICIFENDTDSWCLETTPPHLKIGWDYDQTFEEIEKNAAGDLMSYWQIKLIFYADSYFYMQSLFDVQRLLHNTFTVNLEQFRTDYFVSLIINQDKKWCKGSGWDREAVNLTISMEQTSVDCYKTIINDICGFDGVFYGPDAKYFEECYVSDNTDASDMQFTTWEFRTAQSDQLIAGTTDPLAQEKGCPSLPGYLTLPGASQGPAVFADMAYSRLGNYVRANYLQDDGTVRGMPFLQYGPLF